jgi:hypothetical protein
LSLITFKKCKTTALSSILAATSIYKAQEDENNTGKKGLKLYKVLGAQVTAFGQVS